MELSRIYLCLPLLLAFACKTKETSPEAEVQATDSTASEGAQPQAVFDIWKKHVEEETGGKQIQPDCKPTHFGPTPGTPSKGIVVLYHGFTACPQQFFDVSKKLVEQGFDVFLPLMPGQGRMPLDEKNRSGVAKDNLADLPVNLDVSAIVRTAQRMNELAAAGKGVKVVGGLSGGGGLATGTAIEGKGVWDRAIFMAPFYKFRITIGPLTAFMDQIYPGFATNYGKDCMKDRGISGKRNGLCSVTVEAMRTMLQYGLEYRKRVSELGIPVQYVGAENDATINNKEMVAASRDVKDVSICFFYKGVPHSMMSRYENLQTNHAWMTSLEQHMVDFISNGTRFPTDGVSSEDKAPKCKVDMKPER